MIAASALLFAFLLLEFKAFVKRIFLMIYIRYLAYSCISKVDGVGDQDREHRQPWNQ